MYSRKVIISVGGVILFLIAGVFSMFFLPSEAPNTSAPVASTTSQSTAQPTTSEPQKESTTLLHENKVWYVYVTGAVNSPGIYTLSEDSRVFQAVEAAGGFTSRADRASLNLAEVLADEAHVHVAAVDEARTQGALDVVRIPGYSSQARSTSQTNNGSGLININRAEAQELQSINGVGPVIAQRIVDYRSRHGAFTRIEDLLNVKGIGTAKLNQMRSQITTRGKNSYTTTTLQNSSARAKTNSNLIDINHANSQELQRINGVGQATAQRILDYREKHGAFTRPEDLLNVRGIGASKLSQIRSQIVIR